MGEGHVHGAGGDQADENKEYRKTVPPRSSSISMCMSANDYVKQSDLCILDYASGITVYSRSPVSVAECNVYS